MGEREGVEEGRKKERERERDVWLLYSFILCAIASYNAYKPNSIIISLHEVNIMDSVV